MAFDLGPGEAKIEMFKSTHAGDCSTLEISPSVACKKLRG